MGFWDRLLRRGSGEQLPTLPDEVAVAHVDRLSVRTAAELVIVIVSTDGAAQLVAGARERRPLRLRAGGRPVTIIPVDRDARIVLDPQQGWIIPLTEAQALGVADAVRAAPGEYEVAGRGLAVIVED